MFLDVENGFIYSFIWALVYAGFVPALNGLTLGNGGIGRLVEALVS